MKAEEILRDSFKSLIEAIVKNPEWLKPPYDHLVVDWAYDAVRALREAGMLVEWRTDIENAPTERLEDKEILIHSGVFLLVGEPLGGGRFYEVGCPGVKPTHFALISPPEEK